MTADGESLGVGAVILDLTERERAQSRLRFLARASEILAASLVVEDVVPAIAELAVETFCESCAVWALQGDELVLLARADVPGRDPSALAHFDRLSMTTDSRVPVVRVVADGKPRHLPAISDEELRAIATDEQQFEQLVEHGNRSSMLLPLVVRGTVRGALGLGSRTPGRHDDGDFEVAARARARGSRSSSTRPTCTARLRSRSRSSTRSSRPRRPGSRSSTRTSASSGSTTPSPRSTGCPSPTTSAARCTRCCPTWTRGSRTISRSSSGRGSPLGPRRQGRLRPSRG